MDINIILYTTTQVIHCKVEALHFYSIMHGLQVQQSDFFL